MSFLAFMAIEVAFIFEIEGWNFRNVLIWPLGAYKPGRASFGREMGDMSEMLPFRPTRA